MAAIVGILAALLTAGIAVAWDPPPPERSVRRPRVPTRDEHTAFGLHQPELVCVASTRESLVHLAEPPHRGPARRTTSQCTTDQCAPVPA